MLKACFVLSDRCIVNIDSKLESLRYRTSGLECFILLLKCTMEDLYFVIFKNICCQSVCSEYFLYFDCNKA